MQGKVVIVTGANSGVGKETARALARKGAQVVMACRNPQRGEAALAELRADVGAAGQLELMLLDLASLASVRRFAAAFCERYPRLDVLVNNAGVYLPRRQHSADGFELTFAINHLGPFLLTRELLPLLQESAPARIVNVSSAGHMLGWIPWRDLQAERHYFGLARYCHSKLANILHAHELARRLAGSGVTANSLHPGGVASGFAQNEWSPFMVMFKLAKPFLISTAQGASTSIYLASSPEVATVSGQYFARCKPARTARRARSDEDARRLWQLSEQLIESVQPAAL